MALCFVSKPLASAERTQQIIQSGFLDLEFGPPIYILIKSHIVVEMWSIAFVDV